MIDDLNAATAPEATIEHPAASDEQLALLRWAAEHPIDRPTLPVNGRGQYAAVPPGAKGKPKGHTRASTFAEALSDAAGLTTWRHRLLARGLVSTDALIDAVRAAGDDGKALSTHIATALHIAGEKLAADVGTALHTAIEHAIAGTGHRPPAPWDADVDAVLAALSDHRIAIAADHLEWTLYVPGEQLGDRATPVIGRTDALGASPCCDRLHVVDYKTGSDPRRLAYAVQCATYALATHRWVDDAWAEVPPICDQRAYLVHVPAGSGTCSIVEVDLAQTGPYVTLAAEVRAARSTSTLARLFTDAQPGTVVEQLEATIAATGPAAPVAGAGEEATPPASSPDDRTTWMRKRIRALAEYPAARDALPLAMREAGLPLRPPWTDEEIDALHVVVTAVESEVGAPFPAADPAAPSPAEAIAAQVLHVDVPPALPDTTPDDGPWVERTEVDALLSRARALPATAAQLAAAWTAQAKRAGRSFGATSDATWSRRCLAVNTAALELVATFGDDDHELTETVVRHLIGHVIGAELQPTWTTGEVLSTLTIDEAQRLAHIAAAHRDGDDQAQAIAARAFTHQAA